MSEPRFIIQELHPHSGSWNDQIERQNLETLAKQHNLAIGWKPVTPVAGPSPLAEAHVVTPVPEVPPSGPTLVEEEHDTMEEEVYGEADEKEARDQSREDRKEDAPASAAAAAPSAAAPKQRSYEKKKKRA